MAAERIARARRRARVKRVKHMEDVVALERDAGRARACPAGCAAVEQVIQRCIGADEVRRCRRRQRSRVLPRQFDEVRKRAGSPICCGLAAQVGDVAAQHFKRDRGFDAGPGQLERQDDAGAQRRVHFEQRAAFREIDQPDVVTGTTRQPRGLQPLEVSSVAPLVRAPIGTSGFRTGREPARRKTDGEGDCLSGFRRQEFERAHGYTTTVGTSSSPLRNASTNAFTTFGSKSVPDPLRMISLASKGDIALRYGRSLVSES